MVAVAAAAEILTLVYMLGMSEYQVCVKMLSNIYLVECLMLCISYVVPGTVSSYVSSP